MNTRDCPGYGDSATWKPCTGHPNDPRTDYSEDYEDKVESCVDTIVTALRAGDADTAAAVADTFLRYADERDIADLIVCLLQDPLTMLDILYRLINEAVITTARARIAAEECHAVRR